METEPDDTLEQEAQEMMKATGDALRQAPRIAALQAAATVWGRGSSHYPDEVLGTADNFLTWIQK